jgi:hypothetical protein
MRVIASLSSDWSLHAIEHRFTGSFFDAKELVEGMHPRPSLLLGLGGIRTSCQYTTLGEVFG